MLKTTTANGVSVDSLSTTAVIDLGSVVADNTEHADVSAGVELPTFEVEPGIPIEVPIKAESRKRDATDKAAVSKKSKM